MFVAKINFVRAAVIFVAIMTAGCGVSTSELVTLSQGISPPAMKSGLGQDLTEVDQDLPEKMPTKVVNKASLPSPERTNPFELSGEFREEGNGETPGRKKEIRILGFVEVDAPTAMVSIDGKTHLMKAGETEQRVTVLEVLSPNVKLSYDGVTWNASLFDRRN